MKNLFRKILHSSPQDKDDAAVGLEYAYPPLSPSLSLVETRELATIGFLARRIGQLLGLDREQHDSLFYHVIASQSGQDTESVIELAEHLYTWVNNKENVWQKVQSLDVPNNVKHSLLTAYEEFQSQTAGCLGRSREVPNKDNYQIYRDVIYAASQKKFLLIRDEELNHYLQGNILYEHTVKAHEDVPASREGSKKALMELGYEPSSVMSKCLIISEAVTNILKHAEEGKMVLVEDDGEVRVIVEDKGPGFSLPDLPNAVLLAGYSTKKSLGQGFHLMMRMAEQVALFTSSKGSTLILIFGKE